VYLFSHGISRVEFSLENRYLKWQQLQPETNWQAAAATSILDSDSSRKIPRARARNHARNPTQPISRISNYSFKKETII
jgi:hypothetical protein